MVDPASQNVETISPPTDDGASNSVAFSSFNPDGQVTSMSDGCTDSDGSQSDCMTNGSEAPSTTSYCYDPNGDQTASVSPDGNTGSSVATCHATNIVNISGASHSGSTATLSATNSYAVGEVVTVTGVASGYNGTFGITSATGSTFQYVMSTSSPGTYGGSGGQVGAATYSTNSPYQTASSFDSIGETLSQREPVTEAATAGILTTNTFDPAGNEVTTEDANGVTTTMGYTPNDEQNLRSYSDGTGSVTQGFDASGMRVSMADDSGPSTFTYDSFRELTATSDGALQNTQYGYNADGHATSITYPLPSSATWASSDTVTYSLDDADRVTAYTDFNGNTVTETNNPGGLPVELGLPTSTADSIDISYDPISDPYDVRLSQGGSTQAEYSYTAAPSGAMLSESDAGASSSTACNSAAVTFCNTYNPQGLLSTWSPAGGSLVTYNPDPDGNLRTLPSGGLATYDFADQIKAQYGSSTLGCAGQQSISSVSLVYCHDADGNVTSQQSSGGATVLATWNGAHEVTSYSDSSADMSSAVYNGDGYRVSESVTPMAEVHQQTSSSRTRLTG